jgi:RNA-binding protein
MLKGYQKKYLKGLAHSLKPVVIVGQKGMSDSFIRAIDDALDVHELIKIKFIEHKEKKQKRTITEQIQAATGCETIAMIGHTAVMYRPHRDPEKRKIRIPQR